MELQWQLLDLVKNDAALVSGAEQSAAIMNARGHAIGDAEELGVSNVPTRNGRAIDHDQRLVGAGALMQHPRDELLARTCAPFYQRYAGASGHRGLRLKHRARAIERGPQLGTGVGAFVLERKDVRFESWRKLTEPIARAQALALLDDDADVFADAQNCS